MSPKTGPAPGNQGSTAAAERLSKVAGHLVTDQDEASSPSEFARRNRRSKSQRPNGPPADYSDVLSNLQKLNNIAHTPDLTNRGYVRQKREGKLWVRERVDQLLDHGSFKEIGSASGQTQWKQTGPRDEEPVSFTPTNNLQGGFAII
jgi:hypothetical protein